AFNSSGLFLRCTAPRPPPFAIKPPGWVRRGASAQPVGADPQLRTFNQPIKTSGTVEPTTSSF
ncbi:MAG: hypothetical protein AAFV71_18285, partial [Cyanobacteria bacterium J06633_8]